MPEDILLVAGFALLAWIFLDGMRVREIALRAGRDYCRNIGVQFLDETVSRQAFGLGRNREGAFRLKRVFGFEFTSDGERRYRGEITMIGSRVGGVNVELHRVLH